MKAGALMQKRSHIETASLVVILGIITILAQFTAYYFFSSVYIVIGIACLVTALCTHILLEQTLTYQSCFIYLLLTVFISLLIVFLTFSGDNQDIIPYTDMMLGIVAVNWFIPSLHCYLRNMLDYGSRIEEFTPFFRNTGILFNLFYFGIVLYGTLAKDVFPWAYRALPDQANFTPFWSVATQIEDYLNHMIPLGDIFIYLASRILLYIPYGYYSTLLLRRHSRLARFLSLFLLPILIEALQYFLIPIRCDIDDIIYGFIGGLVGALLFHLNNLIFHAISGKPFLAKDSDFRYSNNSLHF